MGTTQRNVRMAMRDGTQLSADVYLPSVSARRATVLMRTCYTKQQGPIEERARFWTASGYAYVIQDVRGRGESDGAFYPLIHEQNDGSDTIDWIAAQSWSDGRIVMVGGSYAGWTQLFAACSRNSHLVALAPMATPSDPDRGFPMSCGMIVPTAVAWMATLDGRLNQVLDPAKVRAAVQNRPIIESDSVLGKVIPAWRDWVEHAVRDGYWDTQAYQQKLLESAIPMLHVSGWYDDCLKGVLENFTRLSKRPGGESCQRLIVGPWLHGSIGQRMLAGVDLGKAAELDLMKLQREWFDNCLSNREPDSERVQLFVMGRNEWLRAGEWPLRGAEPVNYYFHSDGHANSRLGDGRLTLYPPSEEPVDRFTYDPENPIPYSTVLDWTQVGGPDDFSAIELRTDILVYTSPPVEEPLFVCGPVTVRLFAATSRSDTDWTAKILDVHPDGRAIRLNDGGVRARFRDGHDKEVFITPHCVSEFAIDCWAICVELQVGHRLRVEVSSSAFGKFDVNFNGGGKIGCEAEPFAAEQTVYHTATYPSHLTIQVLRNPTDGVPECERR